MEKRMRKGYGSRIPFSDENPHDGCDLLSVVVMMK